MIESLCVPLDQGKVFAVVLGVAAGAFLARADSKVIGGVQPSVSRKPSTDLSVTIHAFQGRLSAKFVAARAIGGAAKRLVRAG